MVTRRAGRRPGNPDTKEVILQAARSLFAANGFNSTSIRQIAAAAAVDPALIHHYFKSKDRLFLATVQVTVDIPSKMAQVLAGDPNRCGHKLVRTFLEVWDSDDGPSLVAAFRTALADPVTSLMVRDFITTAVIGTLVTAVHLAPDEGPRRAGLIGSQMLGLVVGRYLLGLEPLAKMPAPKVVDAIGPTIQRYLAGSLD
jgi:AcrR family transcriptional regulator